MKGNFKDRNAWVNKIQLTQPSIIGLTNKGHTKLFNITVLKNTFKIGCLIDL